MTVTSVSLFGSALKVTWPLVVTVLRSLLFQAMRLFSSNRVVSASHSTLVPSGPSMAQWLVRSPVFCTEAMLDMKWGKFSKLAHNWNSSAAGRFTMTLWVTRLDILPPHVVVRGRPPPAGPRRIPPPGSHNRRVPAQVVGVFYGLVGQPRQHRWRPRAPTLPARP